MARDIVSRVGDPGESEFGGKPDDPRLGIVPNTHGSMREFLSAYWTNPDDPGSGVDTEGGNIGDTGAQQRRDGEIIRGNQFHIAPPTYSRKYTG